ncbi:MAG TPA: 4Fe-4S dicluster domain-containing protein [Thermoleophilaceae bacterium]|nr:4Fe-4S dicluster domain-containing protein [Thermoleophilaceae bacterium]
MSTLEVRTYGPEAKPRVGFFTDTSLCIGCKACEVACKEWNGVPAAGQSFTGDSYDNTGSLGADTWRHVAFVEQRVPLSAEDGHDLVKVAAARQLAGEADLRWLMSSDVCKHCTHAACLEVCPTGALFRTEFDTVVVQPDVCNGCGYCVPACPFGVLDRREGDGRVWKCTLCYDRLKDDREPACAQACPTNSIQFGVHSELVDRARERVGQLHERGVEGARLYLDGPGDGVGGAGAFFLLLDEPEAYGLPPDPLDPTTRLRGTWGAVAGAALAVAGGLAAAFLGGRR